MAPYMSHLPPLPQAHANKFDVITCIPIYLYSRLSASFWGISGRNAIKSLSRLVQLKQIETLLSFGPGSQAYHISYTLGYHGGGLVHGSRCESKSLPNKVVKQFLTAYPDIIRVTTVPGWIITLRFRLLSQHPGTKIARLEPR